LADLTGERIASQGDRNINVTGGVQGGIRVVNELPRQVLELFARQFGFDPTASDAAALKTYFENVVFEKHSKLSFLFIRPETGKVYTEADVETVFVPLRMTDPETMARQAKLARRMERFDRMPREMEEATRRITLQEILAKYPCFMLRGKPGCGKTTLLRHIALAFARGEQKEKLGWDGPVPLPLMVSLRNFGAFLRSRASQYIDPQPRALLEYLEDHLRGAGVSFSPNFIRGRLESGQCFLLLDALDEASGTLEGGGDLRTAVARQVSAFIRHYARRGNRFALTSRPHAYADEGDPSASSGQGLRRVLREPQVCDVFDLDVEGYRQLITNLLLVLTGDEAAGRGEAQDLVAAIRLNPHLADLAGNPLLCTTLVLVYKYRGRKLPERRVDVLHEIVTLLLGRWYEERHDVYSPDDLAREGTPAATAEQAIQFRRRALVAVAWHMQQDHAAELPAEAAARVLADFYCDEERCADQKAAEKWAHDFLNVAHERSGLFIAVDEGRHAFAHQAFREYLVATRLVNAETLIPELVSRAPEPDDWWEQALLLGGAHPNLADSAAGRLIEALLERAEKSVGHAYLAARCAHDMTDKLPGAQRKKLQDWLIAAMQSSSCSMSDRALAGRALALAGDPRPGVSDLTPRPHLSPLGDSLQGKGESRSPLLVGDPLTGAGGPGERLLPNLLWADIPAGALLVGSRRGETFQTPKGKQEPYDDEYWPDGEPRAIPIPAFKLSAYPITVAQFRPFVEAPDGWTSDEWWTKAGSQDRGGKKEPYYWDDPQWHIENHPVVGVTWYAAVAYCRWLTAKLRASDLQLKHALVRLPTEAEWEWAARGGVALGAALGSRPYGDSTSVGAASPSRSSPSRVWPWGNDWREDACNSAESQIRRTSAVGMFPSGVNWTGNVYDLAGNVWEWCATRWQEKYDDNYSALRGEDEWSDRYLEGEDYRVLRGGSSLNGARFVRGASRDGFDPRLRYTLRGFRCVLWL